MNVIIYKITSPSGKSYIGQVISSKGVLKRWKQHIQTAKSNKYKGSRLLNQAILKYGEDKFTIETICQVHTNIKDATEQFCISFYKTLTPNGYNLQTGGTYTYHSDDTKRKRSESLKELLKDENKRKLWSDVKKGRSQGIKNNRKYDEDKNLPKYIRRIRGESEGYCIDSHPFCKCKKFTSKKLNMDEKLTLATDYLDILNNMVAVQRLDGSG